MQPRYKLVGCSILKDETEALITELRLDIETVWVEWGLHDDIARLNCEVRLSVAACRGAPGVEAILLQYGLCSNGLAGIEALDVPLVIPRVHDCISLFLGGAERYREEHEKEPGTYWYSRAFLHRTEGGEVRGLGAGETSSGQNREAVYQDFVEKYGEDNAAFLMETMVDSWKQHYTRAVFLASEYPGSNEDRGRVRQLAQENGWKFEDRMLDLRLVRMLLTGDWPETEFLVIPPGGRITPTNDRCVVAACGG